MVRCRNKELLCSWNFSTKPAFFIITRSLPTFGCSAPKQVGCTAIHQLRIASLAQCNANSSLASVNFADERSIWEADVLSPLFLHILKKVIMKSCPGLSHLQANHTSCIPLSHPIHPAQCLALQRYSICTMRLMKVLGLLSLSTYFADLLGMCS